MVRGAVYQPGYFQPLHYYARLFSVDRFVLLSQAQLNRKVGQARAVIRGKGGNVTLNVPLCGGNRIRIDEAMPDYSSGWVTQHLKTIEATYSKAPMFSDWFPRIVRDLKRAEMNKMSFAELCKAQIVSIAMFLRYDGMLMHASEKEPLMDGKSLLDVGCGYGGFVEFMHKVAGKRLKYYYGIDMLTECIATAKTKLECVDGICSYDLGIVDISKDAEQEVLKDVFRHHGCDKIDYVIALEVLSTMADPRSFVDALWDFGSDVVVFTVLSPYTHHGQLHAHEPTKILEMCLEKTNYVELIHDKESWFMVVMRRK